MADEHGDARTIPIAKCILALSDAPWEFAEENVVAIAEHWARARIERPKLFNGVVHVLRDWRVDDGTLRGTFLRTDFKSFLYWRETGYGAAAGVWDGFGSSVIRSADGAVMLGRQTEGNMNSGLYYPPSGMIDAKDAGPAGIDIEASVLRELGEESGLVASELERVPGYLLVVAGRLVCVAIEWRSALKADALRARMLDHIRRDPSPELADIVIVRRRGEMDESKVPDYARALLGRILPA